MTMTEIPGMSTPEDYDGNPPGDFQHLTNHPTPGQSTTASGSSSDPTLSLRAAALLTLKSKRRKPATGQSPALPPRPIPSDASVQLDYGQADLTTSDAAPSMVESTSMPSVSSQALISSEAEDGQVREEGEISDTEESAPTAPPIVHPSSTDNISGADRKPMFPRTTSSNSTPVARTEPTSQPLLQRISDPIQLSPIAGPSRLTPPHIPKVESPLPENPNMIDTDHVRPGLAMNQAQYDAAKDIVLDLLGWGVDPEYFLDCGLTRQIVYYTFSELNLRLPNNLDTIGLLPYTPEIISSTQSSPSRRRRSSSLSVPSSQSNICADSLHESPPTRSLGHPSLPPRPRGPRVSSSVSPSLPQVTPAATSLAASSTSAEPGPSLHDMEQQRRQELLARKAVQASRKQKTILIVDGSREAGPPSSVTPSSSNEIRDYDVEMTPIVPREVDDFLKSIGPSNDAGKGKEEAVSRPSTAADRLKQLFFPKPDDMDVDGPIPGFVTSAHTGSPAASEPPLALYSSSAPQVYYPEPTTPASADPLPSPASEPPPSSAESIMTQAGRSVVTEISFDTEETYLNGGPPDPPRRGTKRPVAADFVDFEPRSSVGSGYTNGHGNMLARRKTGSFASVSGMRRCVIDLSDSEDDGEDGERRRAHSVDGEDYQMGRRTHSPVPMRHGSSAPTPTPQHSGRNTPPQLSSTGTMSPAALQEKEQEIRRMRELIAKREESRLKKLAAVSGRTTPNIATANPAFALVGDPPVTTASGEDEESTPTLITPPIANGSANHYPSNGHSSKDTMEEDSPTQDDTHERSRLQQSALITSIPDVPASASTSTGAATSPIGSLSRFLASPTAG